MEYNTLLDALLKQLKNYSTVHRKSIQHYTKGKISQRFPELKVYGTYRPPLIPQQVLNFSAGIVKE